MNIRPARRSDAATVTELINDLVDNTTVTFTTLRKTEEGIAGEIEERGDAFQIAEVDGQPVGFATFFPFRAGPGYAGTQEHSIVLASDARGIGAGRALMHVLEEVARGRGVHTLIAGVSAENTDAQAFHAALGFVEVGRLPEVGSKFGRRLDLVLMQKRL